MPPLRNGRGIEANRTIAVVEDEARRQAGRESRCQRMDPDGGHNRTGMGVAPVASCYDAEPVPNYQLSRPVNCSTRGELFGPLLFENCFVMIPVAGSGSLNPGMLKTLKKSMLNRSCMPSLS